MRQGYDSIVDRAQTTGTALVIGERDGPVAEDSIPSPHETLITFERPGGLSAAVLFRVTSDP
jgi:hypothetical protein